MQKLHNIKRVAVIGGGPAGVAMAKYLVAEKAFTTIDVFEQRSTCGGVWNYTSDNDREAQFHVPQTKPYEEQEEPLWRKGNETNPRLDPKRRHATFISPLYERLEANIPKMLMQHSDLAFPDDEQLFPRHAVITDYLERYADDVRHLISFETQVIEVKPRDPEAKTGFSITTLNLSSKEKQTRDYDAVAVASGHYNAPFIPDIPGLREWNEKYPGSITHSKYYRRPEDFVGKKVLSLGTGASGTDIAFQIQPYCTPPLLVSSRADPTPPSPSPSTRLNVGAVTSFDASTRSIHFASTSDEGVISVISVKDVDVVMFCTGYLYSYPGIDNSLPPFTDHPLLTNPPSPSPSNNSNNTPTQPGARTHSLYFQIFYTPSPRLAFLGLPQKVIPFPISESQAAVIAAVWAGRVGLPSRSEMKAWEEKRVEERGSGTLWHYLRPGEDWLYMSELFRWAVHGALPSTRNMDTATGEPDQPQDCVNGQANGINGQVNRVNGQVTSEPKDIPKASQCSNIKHPPNWGEKERWIRERVMEMKAKFIALGEARHSAKTCEDLGYDFEAWKRGEEAKELQGSLVVRP